jgi:hypothetical protein
MHVRLSRFAGLPPERIDDTIEEFREQQLPELEGQAGFKGVLVMLNRGTGQAAALTFWRASPALPDGLRCASTEQRFGPRDPCKVRCLLLARPALRADSQQPAVAERLPYPTPAPRLDFVELPERLADFLLALSTGSEGVVRLVELRP